MPSYEGDSVTNPDGITHLRQMNPTLSSTIAFNWLQQNHDGHVLVSEHACVQLRLTSVWVLSSPTTTASKWLHGPRTCISDASSTTASNCLQQNHDGHVLVPEHASGMSTPPPPPHQGGRDTDTHQKHSTSSGTQRIFMVVGLRLGSFCAR